MGKVIVIELPILFVRVTVMVPAIEPCEMVNGTRSIATPPKAELLANQELNIEATLKPRKFPVAEQLETLPQLSFMGVVVLNWNAMVRISRVDENSVIPASNPVDVFTGTISRIVGAAEAMVAKAVRVMILPLVVRNLIVNVRVPATVPT